MLLSKHTENKKNIFPKDINPTARRPDHKMIYKKKLARARESS